MAPQVGFEPTTYRLTAECSTTELLGNIKLFLWCIGCQPFGLTPLRFVRRTFSPWRSPSCSTTELLGNIKLFLWCIGCQPFGLTPLRFVRRTFCPWRSPSCSTTPATWDYLFCKQLLLVYKAYNIKYFWDCQ